MPDSKITALASIGTGTDPAVDPLVIVDVSDTTMAASGTTKKVTLNNLLASSPTATLASATITGNLTVDTNTLFVDSANNRVGVGTVTPAAGAALSVLGTTSVSASDYTISSTWASRFQAAANNQPSGIFLSGLTSSGAVVPGSLHVEPVAASSRSALIATYAADSAVGYFAINRFSPSAGTTSQHFKIDDTGVATWSNVGGVAGTAMTLNSSGLGVGVSPGYKLDVAVTSADGIRVKNTLATSAYSNRFHISDNTGIALVGYCPSYVGGTNFGVGANGQSIVSDSAGPLAIGTNTAQSLFLGSNGVTRITLDSSGNVISNVPATAPTLGIDRQMVFNLTSNTNLRISVRGTDGVTRTTNLTLT